MNDFHMYHDVLRGQVAEALVDGDPEHTMFVLAQVDQRLDADELAEAFCYGDHDAPEEVAPFFARLAELIEAQVNEMESGC